MEPPLFTADNRLARGKRAIAFCASMEPPLFTADNVPRTYSFCATSGMLQWSRRYSRRIIKTGIVSTPTFDLSFNGAAVIHGG